MRRRIAHTAAGDAQLTANIRCRFSTSYNCGEENGRWHKEKEAIQRDNTKEARTQWIRIKMKRKAQGETREREREREIECQTDRLRLAPQSSPSLGNSTKLLLLYSSYRSITSSFPLKLCTTIEFYSSSPSLHITRTQKHPVVEATAKRL